MSSDDSDDDFVSYGTPLEPLEEDGVPKKKHFTLEDQVARDSKGRRRFHGAFTGGFSAGFMNTVGSLEGWKPSEFKSSRSERGVFKQQQAFDLMDDEDLGEHGIAPNRLLARPDFDASTSGRKRTAAFHEEGPIPGVPVLQDLLEPVRETVGVRLLKRMGWKPGQGVGPRVTKEKKKVYGCSLPGEEAPESDSDSDLEFDTITFAPDDIRPFIINPKKDTFGLGYTGLDRHSVLGSRSVASELRMKDKNRQVTIRGQAFGVGALEDDDEDIYSKEDMSQYDFALGDAKDNWNDKKISQESGVLDGFVASKIKVTLKTFPLPTLPRGFEPRHEIKKSPTKSSPSNIAKQRGLNRHEFNSEDRGRLLGEAKSVQSVDNEGVPTLPRVPTVTERSTSASNTFKPFVHDESKQKRYEDYLNLSDKGDLVKLQPVHLNEWERERERAEFEQASRIFSPLTGLMGDRFTRAAQPDDLNDPLATVKKIEHGNETLRNAARLKMFGSLTRSECDWQPCSLLCKRFNVPDPHVVGTTEIKQKSRFSIFNPLDVLTIKEEIASEPPTPMRQDSPRDTQADEEMKEDEDAIRTEEAAPPFFADPKSKVDLFKAIFLDSSDDEADSAKTPKTEEQVIFDKPIVNVERNTSPPRGIFAGLDLDLLKGRDKNIPAPVPIVITPKSEEKLDCEPEPIDRTLNDLTYGPKLPDSLPKKSQNVYRRESSSSEDDWVEETKKVKHKKSKHKKHKSKHKKKRR